MISSSIPTNNQSGKTQSVQEIASNQSLPDQAIQSPPLTPEGEPYIMISNRWIDPNDVPKIDPAVLSELTNNGLNTRAILEDDSLQNEISNRPSNLFNSNINEINNPADAEPNSRLIGQQLWSISATLLNHSQIYKPRQSGIRQIVIEEDLLNWPIRGYIDFDNRHEGFERATNESYFHLRSDARNEILLKIWPNSAEEMPPEIFEFRIHGTIYDIEDLESTSVISKVKRLYFWDKNFQALLEKNLQWCTATGKRYKSVECSKPVSHAKDSQRAMIVEEAIASILYEAGLENIIDFTNWEYSDNLIFYSLNANKSIWENIKYLLQHSERILTWDKGIEKLQLIKLDTFFSRAGSSSPGIWQIEHLFFEDIGYTKAVAQSYKAPIDPSNSNISIDFKSSTYSTIYTYKYVQPSGLDTSLTLVSRPVYSHYHSGKQFNVDVRENEIEYAKEYFKNTISSQLLGDYPVFLLNNTKKDQKAIYPIFSPMSTFDKPNNDKNIRKCQGLQKILTAGVFLNQTISARLHGSTHRRIGRFMGVDRLYADSNTNYDYSLLGQYLTVNVKHVITDDIYVNDVVMVKVNAYKNLNDYEGVT